MVLRHGIAAAYLWAGAWQSRTDIPDDVCWDGGSGVLHPVCVVVALIDGQKALTYRPQSRIIAVLCDVAKNVVANCQGSILTASFALRDVGRKIINEEWACLAQDSQREQREQ